MKTLKWSLELQKWNTKTFRVPLVRRKIWCIVRQILHITLSSSSLLAKGRPSKIQSSKRLVVGSRDRILCHMDGRTILCTKSEIRKQLLKGILIHKKEMKEIQENHTKRRQLILATKTPCNDLFLPLAFLERESWRETLLCLEEFHALPKFLSLLQSSFHQFAHTRNNI